MTLDEVLYPMNDPHLGPDSRLNQAMSPYPLGRSPVLAYAAAMLVLVGVIYALASGATRVATLAVAAGCVVVGSLWKERRGKGRESRLTGGVQSSKGSFFIAVANAVAALLDFAVGKYFVGVLFAVLAVLFGLLGRLQRAEQTDSTADRGATASDNAQRSGLPEPDGGGRRTLAIPDRGARSTSGTITVQFRWADGRLGNPRQSVPLAMLGLDRPPPPGAVIRYAGGDWRVAERTPADVYWLVEARP